VLGDVAVQAFGAGVRLATAAEISSLKDEDALTGNEVAVFGKYWGSELSIPQPQAPEGEAEVGGFFIDYVLGSKLNQEIEVTEPILVSGKARGRRDA
jgi:hypothetical protein